MLAAPALELVGLHSHIGSQIFDTGGFEVAAHRVVGLLAEVRDEHGVELPELDLGGGLGIAYTSADDPATSPRWRRRCARSSSASARRTGSPCPRWRSSRAAASSGPATVTLYEVGTVKACRGAAHLRLASTAA